MRYLSKENLRLWRGKTALLRIDLNIEAGSKNYFRIDAVLPTMRLLLKNGVKIVILSHRGRPFLKSKIPARNVSPARNAVSTAGWHSDAGGKNQNVNLSLRSFNQILAKKLKNKIIFIYDIEDTVKLRKEINASKTKLFLLENLRFWPGEETNSPVFAKKLAILGDFYVNDAFPVSHRANASVSAVTRFIPSYAGVQFEKEIKNLHGALKNFKPPLVFILGGAKTFDKLGILKFFKNKADKFLLGGGPATTFFAAEGLPVGDSVVDKSQISKIKSQKYLGLKKIILPVDTIIEKKKILDIGPKTAKIYSDIIKHSKTIVWSGPMGFFENKRFAGGTKAIWEAIFYACENNNAKAVVGGGETVASLEATRGTTRKERGMTRKNFRGSQRKVSVSPRLFLSTGGGAMLDYLAGEKLPGIEALKTISISTIVKNDIIPKIKKYE